MTMSRRGIRLGTWLRLLPAVIAVGVLSGCVVEPAYGPGYYRGYGYYHPYYYRDRDDYYRRW
jgi:hypothetical protein